MLVTYDRSQVRRQIPDIVNSIGVPSECPLEWQAMYLNVKRHDRGHNVGLQSVTKDADPGRYDSICPILNIELLHFYCSLLVAN